MSTLSIFVCTTRWSLLVWPEHVTIDIFNSIYSVDEQSFAFFNLEFIEYTSTAQSRRYAEWCVTVQLTNAGHCVTVRRFMCMCVYSPERAMYQLHCNVFSVFRLRALIILCAALFLVYSDCERWSFCARPVVCTVTTCLEWTFCMTKFHEFSVIHVSYYLRHIVMIYFSPHEVMFVVGCKTITPEAVHISYRTWGGGGGGERSLFPVT